MNEIKETVEAIVKRNGLAKVKYITKQFFKSDLDEEELEDLFYFYMEDLGIDVNSEEFEIISNGGGLLSGNEMIKVMELFKQ